MKKFTILFAFLFLFGLGAHAETQEPQFPIQELGGCTSKDACKAYCDNPANSAACMSFAKAHALVSPDQQRQIDQHARILNIIQTTGGPGGCNSDEACKAYCSDSSHMEECKAFAASVGLEPPKNGNPNQGMQKPPLPPLKGPAGCSSDNDCKAYCQAHIDECLKFVMNNLRACQMPPGLKNNPNGIPDNFRNGSTTRPNMPGPRPLPAGSTTLQIPPRPIGPSGPTSLNTNRSFLSNILNAILGR